MLAYLGFWIVEQSTALMCVCTAEGSCCVVHNNATCSGRVRVSLKIVVDLGHNRPFFACRKPYI
jgi:hypothetical protein